MPRAIDAEAGFDEWWIDQHGRLPPFEQLREWEEEWQRMETLRARIEVARMWVQLYDDSKTAWVGCQIRNARRKA